MFPANWEIGTLRQGRVNAEFSLSNKGPLPFRPKVSLSCGSCLRVIRFPNRIAPGESGTLELEFNSTGLTGEVTRFCSIVDSEGGSDSHRITIHATVLPPADTISFDPAYVDFGVVPTGQIRRAKIVVSGGESSSIEGLKCVNPPPNMGMTLNMVEASSNEGFIVLDYLSQGGRVMHRELLFQNARGETLKSSVVVTGRSKGRVRAEPGEILIRGDDTLDTFSTVVRLRADNALAGTFHVLNRDEIARAGFSFDRSEGKEGNIALELRREAHGRAGAPAREGKMVSLLLGFEEKDMKELVEIPVFFMRGSG